jgi:hypothetical protein
VCKCGVSSTPVVEERTYHFGARGLYNGGLLLGDRESGSYWHHVTGECVYGPLRGRRYQVYPLVHTIARDALEAHPNAQIGISSMSLAQRAIARTQDAVLRLLRGRLPPGFGWTMGPEDPRRPRMQPGLAVWTEGAQRFYAIDQLRARGGAVMDELDGQQMLVFVDPTSGRPACLRTDASSLVWRDETLALDTGERVRGSFLRSAQGATITGTRPMQSVLCWYSFAYAFPGGQVYEEKPQLQGGTSGR